MRHAILVSILTGALVVGAAAVYAGPPIAGTYKSSDGDFDEGTATTYHAVSSYLANANHILARSTSGGVFTNDWSISCPQIQTVVLLVPKAGPTGHTVHQITYGAGYVTLGGPGNPWDGGDATYTGTIDSYVEIRTVQWVNDVIVGAASDHAISAHIQGYNESCVSWAIGNGSLRGGTPGGFYGFSYPPLQSVKPADYPHFPRPADCGVSATLRGHWDDIRDLTLSIAGCTVKTEQSSWGSVKAMYRN